MVNRPRASVVRCRDTRVSKEVAVTTAPARGWLSGPVTVPVMISVVVPTCASAGCAAAIATSTTIPKRRRGRSSSRTIRATTRGRLILASRSWFRCRSRRGCPEELGHVRSRRCRPRERGQTECLGREPQRALVLIPGGGPVIPLRLGAHAHPHDPSPSAGRVILGFIEDDDQQAVPSKLRARDQPWDGGSEPLVRGVERATVAPNRSEEHTSELQSQSNLVCRLLLEKKKK